MDTTKTSSETTKKPSDLAFKITGDWINQSKQLKTKYPHLTDADLKFEPGKEEQLLSRLQSRLHKSRE